MGAKSLVAVLFLGLVTAQATTQSNPLAQLTEERGLCRIGFARLEGEALSLNQEAMRDTIPLRLKALLSQIQRRSLSDKEVEAYQNSRLLAKVLEIGGRLADQVDQYDVKFLNEKTKAALLKARKPLIPQIENSRVELKAYLAMAPEIVIASDSKNISWIDFDAANPLYEAPLRGASALCRKADLDILISGSLRAVGDYAFLELYAYHRYLDTRIFEWKTALADDDSQAALDEFSSELALAILGRKTALLQVEVQPPDSDIWVNGAFLGSSPLILPFEDSGAFEILASKSGYLDERSLVTLEAGEEKTIKMSLPSLDLGSISISTEPEGAKLYLRGTETGESPLELKLNGEARSLRARKEGFKDSFFVVEADAEKPLQIRLMDLEKSQKNSFDKQKRRFYLSAGAFMLSLPASVICVGMYNQYRSNIFRVNDSEDYTSAEREAAGGAMNNPYYIWQGAAYGSSGLSGALLGYTVYRFILYIRSSI